MCLECDPSIQIRVHLKSNLLGQSWLQLLPFVLFSFSNYRVFPITTAPIVYEKIRTFLFKRYTSIFFSFSNTWSWHRLIFIMGIPILVKRYLYIETGPLWEMKIHLTLMLMTLMTTNWHEIIWHWAVMGNSKSKVKSLYLPKEASHMHRSEAKEENIDH